MFSDEAAKLLAAALVGRVDKGIGRLVSVARAKLGSRFGSGPASVAELRELVLAACQEDPAFHAELMNAVEALDAAENRVPAPESVDPFFNYTAFLREPPEGGIRVFYGPPGSGKTELARKAAGAVRDRFPGGWIETDVAEFRSGSVVDLALLKRAVLRRLGIPGGELVLDDAGLDEQFRRVLALRRFVLVLDNVVSAREVALFRPFPLSLVLATCTVRTRDLDLLDRDPVLLGGLELPGAREMLASFAGSVRLDAEPAAADELLAMCDRLPGAIQQVGLTLARRGGESAPVRGLAEYYRANGILAAEDVVRDSMEQTFAPLDPEVTDAAALLAGFPGVWFTRPTALAYLGMPDQVFDRLDSARIREQAGDWYRLTALAGQYAARLPADRDAAFLRLLDHLRDHVVAADLAGDPGRLREYRVPQGLQWTVGEDRIGWLDKHLGLITELARGAYRRGRHVEVCQLAGALEVLVTARWRWREYAEISELAVRSAAELPDNEALYSRTLSMRAKTRFLARSFEPAEADLQHAWLLAGSGTMRPARRGRLQASVAEFVARCVEERADALGPVAALGPEAAAERAALLAKAEEWLRKAIEIDLGLDHGYALAIHPRMLASVLVKAGRAAEARAEIDRYRHYATGRNLSRYDMVAARACLALGDVMRARELWSRARHELKATGVDQYQWEVREIEARIIAAEGRFDVARAVWGRLAWDASRIGHPRAADYLTELESLR